MSELKILMIIKNEQTITQREIAKQLNISLGKVNLSIKKLLDSEKVVYNNRKYHVTQAGEKDIDSYLNDQKEYKLSLPKFHTIKNAIILSDSKRKYDYFKPIFGQETLIERNVRLLLELGIEKIIIVVGYQKDLIKKYLKKYADIVTFIENEQYLWNGSLYSLSLCRDVVCDDFVLVEGNSVFDSVSLYNFYYNSQDSILCSSPYDISTQRYVQWDKNYHIEDISSNNFEIARIDGVMVGLNKIQKDLFEKMIEYYDNANNKSIEYAYALNFVARDVSICIKFDNHAVAYFIEDDKSLKYVEKTIVKKMKKRESAMNRLSTTFEHIFDNEKILLMEDAGGLTNNNYIVKTDKEEYVMRLPGAGSNELVNRINEKNNILATQSLDINVPTYYFNEDSGVKITKRIKNCVTLTSEMSQYPYYIQKMVNIFHKLHRSGITLKNEFNFTNEYKKYEKLVQSNGAFFENYEEVKKQVLHIYNTMKKDLDFTLVSCHNDTLCDNFIMDKNERMYLIDWEYAGMNDLFWDLAAVMLENNYTPEAEELLLYHYFEGKVSEFHHQKILVFKILQDFLWTLWSNYKISLGEDFNDYGLMRYERCIELMKEYNEKYE